MRLGLDFETYSELDITKVGAHKYAMHPSTEVLMAAYSIDGQRYFWDATQGAMPVMLAQALDDPATLIHAFNAQFERLILKYVLGRDIPVSRFRCTMVRAYSHSFKGTLFDVGEQLEIPEEFLKSKAGGALIRRFSKPAPKNHKARRYTRESHPQEWEQFCLYCQGDELAEYTIDKRLDEYGPWPEAQQRLYELDQKINDAGVPVDTDMIEAAQVIARQTHNRLLARLKELTGVDNPKSNDQLITWLTWRGVVVPQKYSQAKKKSVPSLDKTSVAKLLDEWGNHPLIGEVLRAKSQLSKTSVTKYRAFERAEHEGLVRGMFQCRGAQRTGRWAGRVVQLHNLASPRIKDVATAAEFVKFRNAELLEMMYGDPLQTLSYTVRPTICAPPGKVFNVSDLSSIESRLLGWHADCKRINEIFAAGKDTYKDFATEFYGIPYETVTPEQRKFCKPPVLGCGYRLSGSTLVEYGAGMGVTIPKVDAFRAVKIWRAAYPEVPRMWKWLEEAIERVIRYGSVEQGYAVRIYRQADMLVIQLPSGRPLYYHKPEMQLVTVSFETEDGEIRTIEKEGITFMGTDKYRPNVWTRVSAHGGVFTENFVQAHAADVLAEWMLRADATGFSIRGHVHDEEITLEDRDRLEELNALARKPMPWAPTLLLDAEGYVATRYRKD